MMPETIAIGKFSKVSRFLLGLAFGISLIFWGSKTFDTSYATVMIKWLPIGCLAAIAWLERVTKWEKVLAGALIVHSIGDVFMELDVIMPGKFLIQGMLAFLAGHAIYIYIFKGNVKTWKLSSSNKLLLGCTLAYASAMCAIVVSAIVSNGPRDLAAPLVVYMCFVVGSVAMSIFAGYRSSFVVAGTMLFMFSDSLIAVELFISSWEYWNMFYLPLYFFGQVMIVLGVLNEAKIRR